MSELNINEHSIYYTKQGEGPVLLLLHGNTASSVMFQEAIERYAKHHCVIAMDFLGHGNSSRVSRLATDLWFDEAMQVIALIKALKLPPVDIIGVSGGALVALNVALEASELVRHVIADSFEGEYPLQMVIEHIWEDRAQSKQDPSMRAFYGAMHGSDWELVVDQDSDAMIRHANEVGRFFHKELSTIQANVLFTGSKQDEFLQVVGSDYFDRVYQDMLKKIGHGTYHLFPQGGHPAMLSNLDSFVDISEQFFSK